MQRKVKTDDVTDLVMLGDLRLTIDEIYQLVKFHYGVLAVLCSLDIENAPLRSFILRRISLFEQHLDTPQRKFLRTEVPLDFESRFWETFAAVIPANGQEKTLRMIMQASTGESLGRSWANIGMNNEEVLDSHGTG